MDVFALLKNEIEGNDMLFAVIVFIITLIFTCLVCNDKEDYTNPYS